MTDSIDSTDSVDPSSSGARAGCPGDAELRALLGGELHADDQQRIEGHLDECAECPGRLEHLAGNADWVPPRLAQRDSTESGPPALREAISRLHTERSLGPDGEEHDAGGGEGLAFLRPPEKEGHLGRFGPYNAIKVLGRGGMGIVLKAEEPSLNRIVAVKVLTPILAASPTARERFQREARAAAAVIHENVVTVHAVDEIDGLPFLVMHFVSGQSLEGRIRRSGPLKLPETLRIASQMAAGLAAAHAQGVVHRDIKPANILLENGVERVKITDFGVARAAEDSALTHTGHVVGTPQYMSPEQASGERVDHRADLFSLGAVMYTMCTGKQPFGSASPLVTIRKVCEEELPAVHSLNPEMPAWMSEIVARLLRKDPAKRYQSADEVARMLSERLARIQAAPGQADSDSNRDARCSGSDSISHDSARRRTGERSLLPFGAVAAMVLALCALIALTELAGWTSFFREQSPGSFERDIAEEFDRPDGTGAVFAVLGTPDREESLFPALSEAIQSAAPGDTIEIRSSGRFTLRPISLEGKPLTIRAAPGARPVLLCRKDVLVATDSLLVLEGLDFVVGTARGRLQRARNGQALESVVISHGAPLFVANCRFRGPLDRRASANGVAALNAPLCIVRNCELYLLGSSVSWKADRPEAAEAPPGELVIENCVPTGRIGIAIDATGGSSSVVLRRNAFRYHVGNRVFQIDAIGPDARVDVSSTANVFASRGIVVLDTAMDREGFSRFMHWRESGSVYGPEEFVWNARTAQPLDGVGTLEDWLRLWGQDETDAVAGLPTFAIGRGNVENPQDVMQPAAAHLDSVQVEGAAALTREELRQLGVEVNTLGPGAGYDAWRASPEYEEWLEEIERVRE